MINILRRIMGNIEFRNLKFAYSEPLIDKFYNEIYLPAFPIVDERENLEDWKTRLHQDLPDQPETHIILAGYGLSGDKPLIVGGQVVEYCKKSNAGLLTYIVVDSKYRKKGFAKLLLKEAITVIDQAAARSNPPKKPFAYFAEANDPLFKISLEDPYKSNERLKSLSKLGFYLVQFPYIQPKLSKEKNRYYGLKLIVHEDTWKNSSDDTSKYKLESKVLENFLLEFHTVCEGERPQEDDLDFVYMNKYLSQHPIIDCLPLDLKKISIKHRELLLDLSLVHNLDLKKISDDPYLKFDNYSITLTFLKKVFKQIDIRSARKRLQARTKFVFDHFEPFCSFLQDITKSIFWDSMPIVVCLNPKDPTIVDVSFPNDFVYLAEGRCNRISLKPEEANNQEHSGIRVRSFKVFDNLTIFQSGYMAFSFSFVPVSLEIDDQLGSNMTLGNTHNLDQKNQLSATDTDDENKENKVVPESVINEFDVISLMKIAYTNEVGERFREDITLSITPGKHQTILEFANSRIKKHINEHGALENLINNILGIKHHKKLKDETLEWKDIKGGIVQIISEDYTSKLFDSMPPDEDSPNNVEKKESEDNDSDSLDDPPFKPDCPSYNNEKLKALLGILQGILDYQFIEPAEIEDSLDPSYTNDNKDEYYYVHPRFIVAFMNEDRAFNDLSSVVGVSPYLLYPSDICLLNGLLLENADKVLQRLVLSGEEAEIHNSELLGGIEKSVDTIDNIIKIWYLHFKNILKRTTNLKIESTKTMIDLLRSKTFYFLPNIFRYDTETALYDCAISNRGIKERSVHLDKELEQYIKILNRYDRLQERESSTGLTILLFVIAVFGILEVRNAYNGGTFNETFSKIVDFTFLIFIVILLFIIVFKIIICLIDFFERRDES